MWDCGFAAEAMAPNKANCPPGEGEPAVNSCHTNTYGERDKMPAIAADAEGLLETGRYRT